MKLMAAVALACGFAAAPMTGAAHAGATPSYCDGAGCVPYVSHGAVRGEHCTTATRYVFGLDPSGATLVCGARGEWMSSAPLVGVRTLRLPCGDATQVAQSPDGVPLSCIGGAWSDDYRAVFA